MFVTKHFLASESAVNNAFSITVASDYSVYNSFETHDTHSVLLSPSLDDANSSCHAPDCIGVC